MRLSSAFIAVVNCSEQLCDAHEVCLLQIFEAGESLVEILRQVKHLLRYFNNFSFLGTGRLYEFLDDFICNQCISLKLLANLEGDIERTDAYQ